MSYIQLVQIVLTIRGRIGYCLEYARMVCGAPVVESNAWNAWNATKFKHLDRNLPNVCVPVWFSYIENGVNLGHVVWWVPGVGFYSSPWQQGTDHAVLSSIEEVERIYHCKYVGWSEDISNVRVAKEGSMDKITKEQEDTCALMQTASYPGKDYNYQFTGRDLTQDNLDAMLQFWSGMPCPAQPPQGLIPDPDGDKWREYKKLTKDLQS